MKAKKKYESDFVRELERSLSVALCPWLERLEEVKW